MDITPDENQARFRDTAREYATSVIAPAAAEIDREERFPSEILKGLCDRGLMAIGVPKEYGGAGAGTVAYALAMQEVSRACASTAVTMAVTNMVGEVIATFGSEEQRTYFNPKLASGEFKAGSFGLSEPGAGSDAGGMTTTAVRDGDEWVINGQKQWITSGAHAGVIVVWARTGDREKLPGTRGISCFLVEGGTNGLHIGKPEDKMGLRGSNTVSLTFDGCRVPASAQLGELNSGFRIAMMALDGGRIGISSQAIGIARGALEESVRYAQERPLGLEQGTQWKLADMKTELDAANLLALRAAWLKEQRRAFSREASMAKVFATEAANRICNSAVQIHGEDGYARSFAAERHLRDVRVTMIYEGTSEVQRLVIARSALA